MDGAVATLTASGAAMLRAAPLLVDAEPKIRAGVLGLLHDLAGTKTGGPKSIRE